MSTRATYDFKDTNRSCTRLTKIYIHHDGYPEGAACYFRDALFHENTRGGFDTRFIRANEGAELTDGNHGDTEFHYDYAPDADLLEAYKYYYDDNDRKQKGLIYRGTLIDFINRYYEPAKTDPEEVLFKAKYGYGTHTTTKKRLRERLKACVLELQDYKEKHPTHTGNIGHLEDRVTEIEQILGKEVA